MAPWRHIGPGTIAASVAQLLRLTTIDAQQTDGDGQVPGSCQPVEEKILAEAGILNLNAWG